MRKLVLATLLAGGLLGFLAGDRFRIRATDDESATAASYVTWTAAVALLGGAGYGVIGYLRACPKCRRWWALRTLGLRRLKKRKGLGTVTRQSQGVGISENGTSFETTSYEEQAVVVRSVHWLNQSCGYCGFRWTERQTSESESW